MPHEIQAFEDALSGPLGTSSLFEFVYISSRLDAGTATLARGADVVCLFVVDTADAQVLRILASNGVRLVALRSPGVGSVDLRIAAKLGIRVARTPPHAPASIAEYTVSMILALNRKIHLAVNRVRDGNFGLNGLVGFEMHSKTVGIIGTGKVGTASARILAGFGCSLLAYDIAESEEVIAVGGRYVSMAKLLSASDIIVLHAPLLASTHHIICHESLSRCKQGVMIVNTSRGGLIDIHAVIEGLRNGTVGSLGIDVYEGESRLFFRDNTGEPLDADFEVLRSMPNVIVTGHQSTLTDCTLEATANATIRTLLQFSSGDPMQYEVSALKRRSAGTSPQAIPGTAIDESVSSSATIGSSDAGNASTSRQPHVSVAQVAPSGRPATPSPTSPLAIPVCTSTIANHSSRAPESPPAVLSSHDT